MANPLDVIERKLDKVDRKLTQLEDSLSQEIREMESLMTAFDCDPVLDVEVFSFTDGVNAKREAAGLEPVSRVTYALTKSIESAYKLGMEMSDVEDR